MSTKNILQEIEQDVEDVSNTRFVYTGTTLLPSANDAGLTYERGSEKKGKILNTCVLYVDIRNSVGLTEKHQSVTMGKIYTAFTKAVLKIGRYHHGHTRNIIGDRVMIVFPEDSCYSHAVDCTISINHIAQYIIRKQFPGVDFTCGIGIDFGELRIIKVGIQRNGTEGGENKGLVWAGFPANIASRLTDNANKTTEETYYEVLMNPINLRMFPPDFAGLFGHSAMHANREPLYSAREVTREFTPAEFADSIRQLDSGEMYFVGGKLIRFAKKERTITFPPILMTAEVYNGFKKVNQNRTSIIKDLWKLQTHAIKNVSGKIYGGDIYWNF